jgi:DNA-binding transcriptional regulator YhcF (GntR family)
VRVHARPERSTAIYRTMSVLMYKVCSLWPCGERTLLCPGRHRRDMRKTDHVAELAGGPEYQRVADDLRSRIASGELPVGSAIPSTSKLCEAYGVSVTVIRAAVAQLREAGLVVGHAGKGVFVSATPADISERTVGVNDLARQVGELRAELRRADSARNAEELAELREQVRLLRAQVAELYGELGRPYPGSGLPPEAGRGDDAVRDRPPAPS